MPMRKSLANISWQVDEETYRADKALSYSRLSQFHRNGPRALISTDKIDTPSLRFGSVTDCIMTAPEEFDDKFYVADIDKFSDTIRRIVEFISENDPLQHEFLENVSEVLIIDALNNAEYQTNWKPETRIKKLIELGSDYYTVLKYSTGKIVISPQEFSEAQSCVMTLKTHPFTYQIFECNEDEEIFYQLKFKENISTVNIKMRCMFDILKVNHKEKTIRPIDLKTSGKPEEQFEKSFLEWNYWIQGSSYPTILSEALLKDDYFKDFYLLPFQFIVINKNNLTPLIWEMDLQDTYAYIADKYDTGWVDLLRDANWHLQNGKFDYSRKSYENNGVNPIILKP